MGCCRAWPSSKPAAGPAISPDPFRGWGRKPLAHIRAQREPVVSPAGTGAEYRGPEGSPDDSHSGKSSGDPSRSTEGTLINGMATSAIRGEMTFSSRGPVSARRNAHTVAEGDARWGVPRDAGRFASPSVKSRRGRGVHWHQDALGAARRLREALRLPVEESAGSVPLQSG